MQSDASLYLELIHHSASPKWGIFKLENTTSSMGLSEVVCLLGPIYPAMHRWQRLPQRPSLQVFPTTWKWEMTILAGFPSFKAQDPAPFSQ